MVRRTLLFAGMLGLAACSRSPPPAPPAPDQEWAFYGSDAGGQRYSPAAQVTPANVRALKVAWTFSTGDLASHARGVKQAAFEDTPIMAGGRLYVELPFNEVFALDPGAGRALWRFDPAVDTTVRYGEGFTARGVAYWRNPAAAPSDACAERIFMATNDRRLFALDAATGKPCAGVRQGRGGRHSARRSRSTSRARCRSPRRRWWRAASSWWAPRSTITSG